MGKHGRRTRENARKMLGGKLTMEEALHWSAFKKRTVKQFEKNGTG